MSERVKAGMARAKVQGKKSCQVALMSRTLSRLHRVFE
jgi:hypothetical protein